jgi:hypothetical protein
VALTTMLIEMPRRMLTIPTSPGSSWMAATQKAVCS